MSVKSAIDRWLEIVADIDIPFKAETDDTRAFRAVVRNARCYVIDDREVAQIRDTIFREIESRVGIRVELASQIAGVADDPDARDAMLALSQEVPAPSVLPFPSVALLLDEVLQLHSVSPEGLNTEFVFVGYVVTASSVWAVSTAERPRLVTDLKYTTKQGWIGAIDATAWQISAMLSLITQPSVFVAPLSSNQRHAARKIPRYTPYPYYVLRYDPVRTKGALSKTSLRRLVKINLPSPPESDLRLV
jgi:hypothetical protein